MGEGKDGFAIPAEGAESGSPIASRGSSDTKPSSSTNVLVGLYNRVTYTPERCRYDPNKKFEFSVGLNLLFGFAATFTVANLYYNHPILNKLAEDFDVTDEQASYISTLSQAGYAGGLLLLCPMGDLVKRRPFVLWLVWFTAMIWLGLCLTNNFTVFCALSFIACLTTVTPQLMLPLVGDLAPPHRRATALSIVVSGLLLGMLVARLLSGIVANYISWRYIYWIAFALQHLICILLYFFMPDYRSTNPGVSVLRKYPTLLLDILKMVCKHPILVQACLIGFFTASTFTSYWTTLTFLLAGSPYFYSSLEIGLFALLGIVSMLWGPFFARIFIDKYVPLLSVVIGQVILVIGIIIGTYTGHLSAAGPAIQGLFIDMGLQTSQIGNRTAIYGVEPKARNRVNTAYMVSVFCGQLMGTAAGNHLYARGGWVASGSASVAFGAAGLLICFVRGPHATGWVGWGGGWSLKKSRIPIHATTAADEERAKVSEEPTPESFSSIVDESTTQEVEKRPAPFESEKTLAIDDLSTVGEKIEKDHGENRPTDSEKSMEA